MDRKLQLIPACVTLLGVDAIQHVFSLKADARKMNDLFSIFFISHIGSIFLISHNSSPTEETNNFSPDQDFRVLFLQEA